MHETDDVNVRLAPELGLTLHSYTRALGREAPDETTALYVVGSPALGDLGRKSNVDLVAVTAQPLGSAVLRRLGRSHRGLRRHGREGSVCYVTWQDLARPPAQAAATTFVGRRRVAPAHLANPMTWAILAAHPVAVLGPDRPEVASDADEVRSWFAGQLAIIRRNGWNLLWQSQVSGLVLHTVRCAYGARSGEVVSLSRAAQLWLVDASVQDKRVLGDAAGYRDRGGIGMYWGPLERRRHARALLRHAQDAGRCSDRREVPSVGA